MLRTFLSLLASLVAAGGTPTPQIPPQISTGSSIPKPQQPKVYRLLSLIQLRERN